MQRTPRNRQNHRLLIGLLAAAAGACALASLDGKRGWIAAAVLALAAVQLMVFRLSLNVFGLET